MKDKKMSSKLIITIGREFGAEGHEIGKELAERLGFDFYDKDMLALAAKKSGIDINVLASSDESIMGHFLSPYLTIGKLSPSMGDKLFQVQTDIVHDLAAKRLLSVPSAAPDSIRTCAYKRLKQLTGIRILFINKLRMPLHCPDKSFSGHINRLHKPVLRNSHGL